MESDHEECIPFEPPENMEFPPLGDPIHWMMKANGSFFKHLERGMTNEEALKILDAWKMTYKDRGGRDFCVGLKTAKSQFKKLPKGKRKRFYYTLDGGRCTTAAKALLERYTVTQLLDEIDRIRGAPLDMQVNMLFDLATANKQSCTTSDDEKGCYELMLNGKCNKYMMEVYPARDTPVESEDEENWGSNSETETTAAPSPAGSGPVNEHGKRARDRPLHPEVEADLEAARKKRREADKDEENAWKKQDMFDAEAESKKRRDRHVATMEKPKPKVPRASTEVDVWKENSKITSHIVKLAAAMGYTEEFYKVPDVNDGMKEMTMYFEDKSNTYPDFTGIKPDPTDEMATLVDMVENKADPAPADYQRALGQLSMFKRASNSRLRDLQRDGRRIKFRYVFATNVQPPQHFLDEFHHQGKEVYWIGGTAKEGCTTFFDAESR